MLKMNKKEMIEDIKNIIAEIKLNNKISSSYHGIIYDKINSKYVNFEEWSFVFSNESGSKFICIPTAFIRLEDSTSYLIPYPKTEWDDFKEFEEFLEREISK